MLLSPQGQALECSVSLRQFQNSRRGRGLQHGSERQQQWPYWAEHLQAQQETWDLINQLSHTPAEEAKGQKVDNTNPQPEDEPGSLNSPPSGIFLLLNLLYAVFK